MSQEDESRYEESFIFEAELSRMPYLFYPSYEPMSQGHDPDLVPYWEKFLFDHGFEATATYRANGETVHVYRREIPEFDPAALRIAREFLQGYRARFTQKQSLLLRELGRREGVDPSYLRFISSELHAKMGPMGDILDTLRTEAERLEKKNGTYRDKDDPFDSSTWK